MSDSLHPDVIEGMLSAHAHVIKDLTAQLQDIQERVKRLEKATMITVSLDGKKLTEAVRSASDAVRNRR